MSELLYTRWKRRKKVNSFLNGGRCTHKYQTGKIMCEQNVKGMSVTSSSSEQNNYRVITEDQFFSLNIRNTWEATPIAYTRMLFYLLEYTHLSDNPGHQQIIFQIIVLIFKSFIRPRAISSIILLSSVVCAWWLPNKYQFSYYIYFKCENFQKCVILEKHIFTAGVYCLLIPT